jgi:hypothetical protein
MLGVLVAVLGFDVVTAPCCILRHSGVPHIVVAGILDRTPRITGWADAGRPVIGRMRSLRPLAIVSAVWSERLSVWTVVQDDLRCLGSRVLDGLSPEINALALRVDIEKL